MEHERPVALGEAADAGVDGALGEFRRLVALVNKVNGSSKDAASTAFELNPPLRRKVVAAAMAIVLSRGFADAGCDSLTQRFFCDTPSEAEPDRVGPSALRIVV